MASGHDNLKARYLLSIAQRLLGLHGENISNRYLSLVILARLTAGLYGWSLIEWPRTSEAQGEVGQQYFLGIGLNMIMSRWWRYIWYSFFATSHIHYSSRKEAKDPIIFNNHNYPTAFTLNTPNMSSSKHQSSASNSALVSRKHPDVSDEFKRRKTPWMIYPRPFDAKNLKNLSLALIPDVFRNKGKHSQQPTEQQHSPIVRLPTEIILEITKDLPAASGLSLSHTCSRFLQIADVFIGDLFPPSQRKPDNETRRMTTEQLAFVCMLERDGSLTSSKLVCSFCEYLQKRKYFSPAARAQVPQDRKCIGHGGGIWICPHLIWDYETTINLKNRDQCRPSWPFQGNCHCPVYASFLSESTLMLAYPLYRLKEHDTFDFEQLIPILRAAKLTICSHWESDDQRFLDSFRFNRHPSGLKEQLRKWRETFNRQCLKCGTEVEIGMGGSGRNLYLVLWVYRLYDDKKHYRRLDSQWIKIATQPHEYAARAQRWQHYLETCTEGQCISWRVDTEWRSFSIGISIRKAHHDASWEDSLEDNLCCESKIMSSMSWPISIYKFLGRSSGW